MDLKLTVVYRYKTGANDAETRNAYETLDPAEILAIDAENIRELGGVAGFAFETDMQSDDWVLEVDGDARVEPVTGKG